MVAKEIDMKRLIALFVLLGLPSLYAQTFTYDCGLEYGMKVSLKIQSAAKDSFYEYEGTLEAPGVDATNGTLIRSKTTKLQGSAESEDGTRYFQMHDEKSPVHQVFAEIGENGDTVIVSEITITSINGDVDLKDRDCRLKIQ